MIIGDSKFVKPREINLVVEEPINRKFNNRSRYHSEPFPQFVIYIEKAAWNSFIELAQYEYKLHRNEASGILLGSYFKDELGEFILCSQFQPGTGNETSSTFCEISIDDQVRISSFVKETGLLQLVWIHSHPSFGAFYSSVDNRTLKSMYYGKHQAGIVVDIIRKEYAGFKIIEGARIGKVNDIYLVDLEDAISPTHPYMKPPADLTYTPQGFRPNVTTEKREPIKLSELSRKKIQRSEAMVNSMIVDFLRDTNESLKNVHTGNGVEELQQNLIGRILTLEKTLDSLFGDQPYRSVKPYFEDINEIKWIIKTHLQKADEDTFPEKVNLVISKFEEWKQKIQLKNKRQEQALIENSINIIKTIQMPPSGMNTFQPGQSFFKRKEFMIAIILLATLFLTTLSLFTFFGGK